MSSTTVFHRNLIFSFSCARSRMIFDARSSSRRWIIVTDLAKRVRNMASSTAESPPPTTAMSWSRKKNPSQVAQVDSPWPNRRASDSSPSISDCAPVETMTLRARWVGPAVVSPTQILNGRSLRSTFETFLVMISVPKRSACERKFTMSSGPVIPSGNPGKFSTSVVSMSWPPGWSLVEEGSPSIISGWRFALPA